MLRGADSCDAGKRGDAARDLVEVSRCLFRRFHLTARRLNEKRDDVPRLESDVDPIQPPESLHHENRADDEDHGQCHFGDNKGFAHHRVPTTARFGAAGAECSLRVDS